MSRSSSRSSGWIPAAAAVVTVASLVGLAVWQRSSATSDPDVRNETSSEQEQETAEPETEPESEPESDDDEEAETDLDQDESDAAGDFHHLPDGSDVPPLPTDAPLQVKLGVALFKYKGVQGAGSVSRSRAAAEKLAQEAIALGADDFGKIVDKGDPGSSSNIGWVKRDILEPAVEYPVFTLETGALLDRPLDTPRGFWVVKRRR